ncbi:MAG: hypothetical protein ACI9O4_000566 [Chitinophagales bacterium]|jgi:hypothetical protein
MTISLNTQKHIDWACFALKILPFMNLMNFYRRFPTEESCQLDFKKKRANETPRV